MLQCASFRDVLKVFIYVDQHEIIFFCFISNLDIFISAEQCRIIIGLDDGSSLASTLFLHLVLSL
jgi:hypothetical protein